MSELLDVVWRLREGVFWVYLTAHGNSVFTEKRGYSMTQKTCLPPHRLEFQSSSRTQNRDLIHKYLKGAFPTEEELFESIHTHRQVVNRSRKNGVCVKVSMSLRTDDVEWSMTIKEQMKMDQVAALNKKVRAPMPTVTDCRVGISKRHKVLQTQLTNTHSRQTDELHALQQLHMDQRHAMEREHLCAQLQLQCVNGGTDQQVPGTGHQDRAHELQDSRSKRCDGC